MQILVAIIFTAFALAFLAMCVPAIICMWMDMFDLMKERKEIKVFHEQRKP